MRTPSSPDRLSPDPFANGVTPSSGVLVLLHPGAPDAENSPRAPLLLTLLSDVAALVILLWELRWREVEADYLLMITVFGLAIAAFGFFSCYLRLPSMLGLLALFCLWQGFASAVPCQSLFQLAHTALQPLLVTFALTLRRSRIPLCFTTGRSRQG